MFSRTIGAISATRTPSTWKLRAEPPRSTSVRTTFLSPQPALRFRLTFDAPDKSFVSFYNSASAAHRLETNNAHCLANAMRHEPCSLEGNTQGPGKLVAADAFLGRAQQKHGLQPYPH